HAPHSSQTAGGATQAPSQQPNCPVPKPTLRPSPLGAVPRQVSPGAQSVDPMRHGSLEVLQAPLSCRPPGWVGRALRTNAAPANCGLGPMALHGAVLSTRAPAYWLLAT